MFKRFTTIFLLAISFVSLHLSAEALKATKGPVFTDYGPVFKVADIDIKLVKGFKYKVLFDVAKSAEETFNLNRRIESVARFINMHVMNGVALTDMEIAVVLHGSATRDVFTQKAYQERFLDDNPSLDMIEQLHAKGVKFYLCGQSLYFQQGKKSDLAPLVNLALSAMTISTMLLAEGYSLIP